MIRYTFLVAIAFLAVSWVGAGGRSETAQPQATQSPPASTTPGPETAPEATMDATDLIPMDDTTAELLFSLGMVPFEEKIPSEDFELGLLGGDPGTLFEHRGKVVFLNFWATWCPPCREEMPSMQLLYDELREEGLEILAVNVLENRETAQEFIDEQGFTYPVLLDRDGRVMLRYGVRAYPTTYLIDREGYVIGVRPGFHDWGTDDMIASMRDLLATQ